MHARHLGGPRQDGRRNRDPPTRTEQPWMPTATRIMQRWHKVRAAEQRMRRGHRSRPHPSESGARRELAIVHSHDLAQIEQAPERFARPAVRDQHTPARVAA